MLCACQNVDGCSPNHSQLGNEAGGAAREQNVN
jgi:hypothetical protein